MSKLARHLVTEAMTLRGGVVCDGDGTRLHCRAEKSQIKILAVLARNVSERKEGDVWQFGKLQAKQFVRDPRSFTISDLSALFAALNDIFGRAKEQTQIEKTASSK